MCHLWTGLVYGLWTEYYIPKPSTKIGASSMMTDEHICKHSLMRCDCDCTCESLE